MIYDLQALGCILDGNPVNAAKNTAIFQQAIQAAKGTPGPIYLGMGNGLAVLNGKLELSGANMVLRGEAGMGTVPSWGQTSTILGVGPGDTLKVSQGGCRVSGLAWKNDGQQSGTDASLKITETQVDVWDHYFDSPNIGISVQRKSNDTFIGQSWLRNILMGGYIKQAGCDINTGWGAVRLDHVIMFNGVMDPNDPQPPYGILVKSAGELMLDRCDIDNCGANLAIVPGIDNVPNTFVQNLDINNCDFDNGNGDGQILIRPYGSSFILNTQITNAWCSTAQTASSTWPGNGLTIDGSRAHAITGARPIMNVSVSTSVFQYSIRHCGIYAHSVQGLSITNSTAAGNYVGFQTNNCVGLISNVKAGAYEAPYLGASVPGNTTYGVLLEKSNMKFNPAENALDGNGVGPYWIIP